MKGEEESSEVLGVAVVVAVAGVMFAVLAISEGLRVFLVRPAKLHTNWALYEVL